jgi:glutaredoxin
MFCKAEKKYLDDHHVSYQAFDVEADSKANDELTNLSHQLGVPFTIITKTDGATVTVLGFDRAKIAAELGLAT